MSENIVPGSLDEILQRPEIQVFVSAAVVRQSARIPLPEILVNYHSGILEEMGVNLDKLRHMSSEDLMPILPDVLNIRR